MVYPSPQRPQNPIEDIIHKHGRQRKKLLPILQDIVALQGLLSPSSMRHIATALDISAAEVYGTATFYEFLPTRPVGVHVIRLCKNISCYMEGKDQILAAMENYLGCKLGETSCDGQFTLLAANCLGWCHKGPAMLVDEVPYTELTAESAIAALAALRCAGGIRDAKSGGCHE